MEVPPGRIHIYLCRIVRKEGSVVKEKHYLLGYFSETGPGLSSCGASCLESLQKEELLLS